MEICKKKVAIVIIRDALYGAFELPTFLNALVTAPEFRRLSEVRLININSITLSALADVRRYSHTLGTLRLAIGNPLANLGEDEHRAFLACVIVHDIGTPAFAHLFEYFLLDQFNWDHETVVPLILRREYHPDAASHQIYRSQIPQFEALCRKARVDFDLVLAILEGKHPASRLIFGSLDFDNIDNVARMNWMLGHRFDTERMISLASGLGVRGDTPLLLPKAQKPNVELWAELRRKAYDVLVFDGPTVAGQAVLSAAISEALADNVIATEDWYHPDADLIKIIRDNSPKGKQRLDRDFFGTVPELMMISHLKEHSHPLQHVSRESVIGLIEEFLYQRLNAKRAYGYCLRDRGTFEKQIDAVDPENGDAWTVGSRSDSLIVYGFAKRCRRAATPDMLGNEFVEWSERKLC